MVKGYRKTPLFGPPIFDPTDFERIGLGMKKVLFICTGNTCRGPMAQGIFQKLTKNFSQKAECASAGILAVKGQKVTPWTRQVCQEIGVDISQYRAECLTDEKMAEWDLLVVMTEDQRMVIVGAGIPENKVVLLGVEDPYGGSIDNYRKCRDLLEQRLRERVLPLLNQ